MIASPQASESRWVCQEVDWWLDRHDSPDKIIIVRSAGTFRFDPAGGVAHTDALPPRLAAALRHREPKVLELPRTPGSQHLDTRGERWTELVADIVARLDGVAKDELIGEHIRNARRWRQLRVGAANWQFSEVLSGLRAGESVVVSVDRKGVVPGARVGIEK